MTHVRIARLVRVAAALAIVLASLLATGAGTLAVGDRWRPQPGISWDIWLSEPPAPGEDPGVEALDVDLFDTPPQTISRLQDDAGVQVICYFSAGSAENWRIDFPQLAPWRGRPLSGWPGEWWIDVRRPEVRAVMLARLDLAAEKGCDAVDPDNVDGYANRNGLGLTASDQVDYLRFLADEAHARGLAVGLKNAVELIPEVVDTFDFAVNEECFRYRECAALEPFVAAGKPVLGIESGGHKVARRVCPQANAAGFSTLVKRLPLDRRTIACRGA